MLDDITIAKNSFCYKTRAASRTITRLYDDALKPTGLKANQFSMLVAINLQAPVSISQLAESLCMERTTLTRNLRPLEKESLVKITDGVGRTRHAHLTEHGKEILTMARPLWKKAQEKINVNLGEQDIATMSRLLNKISQHTFIN